MNTQLYTLTWDELKEGKEYNVYSIQFDVTHKVRLVSFDTTILKRRIAYFEWMERGYPKATSKRDLTLMFMKNQYPKNIFALWDHDLKNNIITPA